ncbi:MAG: hypothetical protein RLY97_1016 [Pseudomonadota bacterium]|jgi:membrane fusion protein (multidrug efflux system)
MAERDPQINLPIEVTDTPIEQGEIAPKRSWGRVAIMLSVPLLVIGAVSGYFYLNQGIIKTDNAYIHQDKVSISAQVTGNIVEVAVHENQMVKAGDLLFRIDPEPYRIAIAQADAAIAGAQVKLVGLQTDLSTTDADIEGARESVRFNQAEYARQSSLMERGFTTKARMQQVEHDLSNARNMLANKVGAQQKARAALASGSAAPGMNPALLAALVQKRKAELELARTEVRAPVSGQISQSSRLELGQMMATGLPAVTIMQSQNSWVEANFKETELADMRIGQSAELTFDAYPELKLKGHVASIGAGTGSEFSVLPAQNASGNWVKVTQRIPVRIAIDDTSKRAMIAGLSTHVRIDTRN